MPKIRYHEHTAFGTASKEASPKVSSTTIVWFRRDLRIAENPAIRAGASRGEVVPLFVWAPEEEGKWAPGAAARWWLHFSLLSLEGALARLGSPLVVRKGGSLAVLKVLVKETGARSVVWNRAYEPASRERDLAVEQALRREGLLVETFAASLLFEPWEIATGEGKPYQVFTPYWRKILASREPDFSDPAPKRLAAPSRRPRSKRVADLGLLPSVDWADGLRDAWTPGEEGARRALERFLRNAFSEYEEDRDRPDRIGTSRLSPHLHFGEIGPKRIWIEARKQEAAERGTRESGAALPFLRQLAWREFAYHLLHHFPRTPEEPLRNLFARFPWRRSRKELVAWQRGLTGYPFVDAGMRELWTTGWMHNRVRMVAASFLTKDLLLPWQEGARWFWDTLVDADLANNTLGWQWTAGCGADAAPYFRVFHPSAQGARYDPEGAYVRRWVREISALPYRFIHEPWKAPEEVLRAAGVRLGKTYPRPIVDHREARERTLAAYGSIKKSSAKKR
ncbi:MAG: deoxyribodipyrimidine photo-lyase [Candidatus Eisenbacteria bacterium]|nr:deoxyribodipyrimidine photo-lyase [Candidatus Eisenbacteria bacterium]